MDWFWTLFSGFVALGVLVVIHEAGHFFVAKMFGVAVPVFSVGIGPRFIGIQFRGTDYRISAFPFGGYVRMAGADPFGERSPEEDLYPLEQQFTQKPIWQRILILLAGPMANLIFPVVVFSIALMIGEPEYSSDVGSVSHDSPAWTHGIREGDRIVSVNGQVVSVWGEFQDALDTYYGETIEIQVLRGKETVSLSLPANAYSLLGYGVPDVNALGLSPLQRSTRIGIDDPHSFAALAGLKTGDWITHVDGRPVNSWNELNQWLQGQQHVLQIMRAERSSEGVQTQSMELHLQKTDEMLWSPPPEDLLSNAWGMVPSDVYVGHIVQNSAALEAGICNDDRIFSLNGKLVRSFSHLVSLVHESQQGVEPGTTKELRLTLIRNGQYLEKTIVPKLSQEMVLSRTMYRPLIGMASYPNSYQGGEMAVRKYGVLDSIQTAMQRTLDSIRNIFSILGGVVTQNIRFQDAMGGPVAIFTQTAKAFEQGIFAYTGLLAMVSLSLGIVNLLPAPVLDGGQILFYSLEGIRGRPLSIALREKIQMIGVLLLFALMLMVTVFDIQRSLRGPEHEQVAQCRVH